MASPNFEADYCVCLTATSFYLGLTEEMSSEAQDLLLHSTCAAVNPLMSRLLPRDRAMVFIRECRSRILSHRRASSSKPPSVLVVVVVPDGYTPSSSEVCCEWLSDLPLIVRRPSATVGEAAALTLAGLPCGVVTATMKCNSEILQEEHLSYQSSKSPGVFFVSVEFLAASVRYQAWCNPLDFVLPDADVAVTEPLSPLEMSFSRRPCMLAARTLAPPLLHVEDSAASVAPSSVRKRVRCTNPKLLREDAVRLLSLTREHVGCSVPPNIESAMPIVDVMEHLQPFDSAALGHTVEALDAPTCIASLSSQLLRHSSSASAPKIFDDALVAFMKEAGSISPSSVNERLVAAVTQHATDLCVCCSDPQLLRCTWERIAAQVDPNMTADDAASQFSALHTADLAVLSNEAPSAPESLAYSVMPSCKPARTSRRFRRLVRRVLKHVHAAHRQLDSVLLSLESALADTLSAVPCSG